MAGGDDEPLKLSRRELLRLGIALPAAATAVLGLAGCTPQSEGASTLAIGIAESVPTLDPAMHRSRTVEAVIRNIFDGLVTRDGDMDIVPELASEWRAVDDLTWELGLRTGVTFHNGAPLTAEDAAFTIERTILPEAIAGKSSPRRGLLGSVESAEATGEHSLTIRTSAPYPILPKMLAFHEVVPKGYVERVGDEEFARHPVGTGPFRLLQHVPGERIVMERFDGYYGGSPEIPPVGPARVRRLVFLPVPEVATRLGALLAGELQIAERVPPHAAPTITSAPGVRLSACTGTRTHFMGMNCTRPPLNDPRVRLAFALGLDLRRMVQRILGGYATVLAGPLVPAAFGFDDTLQPREHDPAAARRLLQQAGLDKSTQIELDCADTEREMAEAAAAQLSELGIRVRPRVWKWDVLQPLLKNLERDFYLMSWGNASLDPAGILLPILQTGARGNFTGYSNPDVDRALELSQTVFDPEVRKALFVKVQRAVHRDVPAIFGWAKQEMSGVSDRVTDWEARPDSMLMMHRTGLRDVAGGGG